MNTSPFSFNRIEGAVKWLLIANVLAYIGQQFFPGWLEASFGLVPAKVTGGFQIWRFVTYAFLHGSLFHLLINMFTLWMFGKEIEYAWGTGEFLKYFFLCSVGGGVLNVALEPFSAAHIIGASGGIYGLLVAFAVMYPDSLIYLYGILPLKAKHFVFLIGAIEFFASFHGSASPIARFAHLGGILTGYLYLKSYEFRSMLSRGYHRVIDSLIVRKRPKFKVEFPPREDLAGEVDRILEKVLTQGADSLTDSEREIMRRYSTRKR